MVKKNWTGLSIISGCLFLFLGFWGATFIYGSMMALISGIMEKIVISDIFAYLVMLFMSLILTGYSLHVAMTAFIPRYFYCMTVVRKYISYSELKAILKKEKFRKVEITYYKNKKIDFYISEKWLFFQSDKALWFWVPHQYYIPRKLILGVDFRVQLRRDIEGLSEVYLITKNKKEINIARFGGAGAGTGRFFKDLRAAIPECINHPNAHLFYEKKQAEFEKVCQNKEDFYRECFI